jgi:hypothetical protein
VKGKGTEVRLHPSIVLLLSKGSLSITSEPYVVCVRARGRENGRPDLREESGEGAWRGSGDATRERGTCRTRTTGW